MEDTFRARRERQDDLAGKNDAKEIYSHLTQRMSHFQRNLDEGFEMGVQLANFGMATEIHVRGIGFKNPNVVEFSGIISDGTEVVLVQHISQLSFMLIAVSPLEEQEPYRIGFRV